MEGKHRLVANAVGNVNVIQDQPAKEHVTVGRDKFVLCKK